MRGWSLFEVIAALVIMSSLLLLSVPTLSGLLKFDDLQSTAKRIVKDLGDASLYAVQSGKSVLFMFDSTSYSATYVGEASKVMTILRGRLGKGERIESPHTVEFYPSGAASPSTITISSSNSVCEVTISLRGRVRWEC